MFDIENCVRIMLTVNSPKVVGDLVDKMIGYNLVTKQTPPEGVLVRKVRDDI